MKRNKRLSCPALEDLIAVGDIKCCKEMYFIKQNKKGA